MAMRVLDQNARDPTIRERRECGLDRRDEVWDGIPLVMPSPNIEQKDLTTEIQLEQEAPLISNPVYVKNRRATVKDESR